MYDSVFVSSDLEDEVSLNEYMSTKLPTFKKEDQRRLSPVVDFYFGFLHREGYTVKKSLVIFPSPAGITDQTLPGRE